MCRTFVISGRSTSDSTSSAVDDSPAATLRVPRPVIADTRDRVGSRSTPARRSALFETISALLSMALRDNVAIVLVQRLAIHRAQRSIRSDTVCACRARATPSASTLSCGLAKAGRVDERDPQAVEIDDFGHEIARRSWHVGDDRARRADERVEEARLADVRLADDRDLQPFADQPPAPRVGEQPSRPLDERVDRCRQRAGIDEVIALFGKIDRRFEPRDEIEQRRVDRRRSSRVSVPCS